MRESIEKDFWSFVCRTENKVVTELLQVCFVNSHLQILLSPLWNKSQIILLLPASQGYMEEEHLCRSSLYGCGFFSWPYLWSENLLVPYQILYDKNYI